MKFVDSAQVRPVWVLVVKISHILILLAVKLSQIFSSSRLALGNVHVIHTTCFSYFGSRYFSFCKLTPRPYSAASRFPAALCSNSTVFLDYLAIWRRLRRIWTVCFVWPMVKTVTGSNQIVFLKLKFILAVMITFQDKFICGTYITSSILQL